MESDGRARTEMQDYGRIPQYRRPVGNRIELQMLGSPKHDHERVYSQRIGLFFELKNKEVVVRWTRQ